MERTAVQAGPSTGEVLVTFTKDGGELRNHLLRNAPGIRAALVDLEDRRAAVERSRHAQHQALTLVEPSFSNPEPIEGESEDDYSGRVTLAVEDHRKALDAARLEHTRRTDEVNRAHDQMLGEINAEVSKVNASAFAAAEQEIADAEEAARNAPPAEGAVESHAP